MLKELFDRRSIRRYEDRPVEPEKLTELLRAAMNAPTARNTQGWRFLVLQDRSTLREMTTLSPYTGMMASAGAAILVLADREANPLEGYLLQDCAAAIENILSEAVHQGLGACWCGIAPRTERIDAFRDYFHLPNRMLPVGIVALGYPAESRPREDQFDPEKVRYWTGASPEEEAI